MKKLILFLSLFLLTGYAYSQVFWTEAFQNSCASGCNAPTYVGPNGAWTVTMTGMNDADANVWYISGSECGNAAGTCGTSCGSVDPSLHIGSSPTIFGDMGASFLNGDGGLGLFFPNTDVRAESPIINCTGKTNITLSFNYIENGDGTLDDATLWYFDGATWAQIDPMAKTPFGGCAPQGQWTGFSILLPASANNNPNVKIGFRWVNNDDSIGDDPSIAVDDITLSVPTITSTITFSLTMPSPVCQSNTLTSTFSTSSGSPTTFTWSATSPNVVFSAANSATTNISFTAPGTFTISLTACQGTVCGTSSASIQVLPPPSLTVTTSPNVVCTPGSSTITVSGGPSTTSYTWTASSGPAISNTNIAVVSPTTNTTYTVSTSVPGCINNYIFNIPVSTPPSLTLTPNSSICSGQSITLNASGASTYTWAPGATLSSTNGAVVTATPATTTNYTVTGSNGVCSNTAVVTVSVSGSTSVTVTPTNTTICLGQTANLVASGGSTYTWTASSGTNPASTASVAVSPTINTTYTVLTGAGTCTAQAVSNVSVAPAFTLNVTPASTTICNGGTVTLVASGATTYSWLPNTNLSATTGATVNANPSANITYTVNGSNGACSNTAIATITVNPTTPLTITATSTLICSGQTTSLTASGGSTYTWTASSGTNPPGAASVTVSPTTTTTYTVLSGSGVCTSSAVTTISVSPAFTVSATPATTTICNGGPGVVITASGGTTYSWSPNTNLSATSGPTVNANPTSNVNYTITSVSGACTSSAVATVSVITVSSSVTASSSNYCIGSTPITLTGSGATTYSWAPGASLGSTTGNTVAASPTITTTYSLTGTTGVCNSNTIITITVSPRDSIHVAATSTVICSGSPSPTLTASGTTTYTWLPGSANTTTILANSFSTTTYTATGTNTAGCINVPAIITVSVAPLVNPTITATSPTVCLSKTVTLSVAPNSAGLTYTWSPTTEIQGSTSSSSITALPSSSATVIYTVVVSNGVCFGFDTISLLVKTAPSANDFIILNNDTICAGGCVTFSATTKGSQPLTYEWYYESGVGTSSVGVHPEACYGSAGSFSVMLITSNVCGIDTVVKSNFVHVFDYPTLTVYGDTTINIGGSATVYASGAMNYYWLADAGNSIACQTCSTTIVQPTVTTQYIVVASNTSYCQVHDTVTVIVDENCGDFFIPNVFSPNDDGLNDVVNVHGRCIYSFNLQIFDRWGEKVFETSSITEGWDGTYRGQKMTTGVYVYKVDGVDLMGDPFKLKGNITLLR